MYKKILRHIAERIAETSVFVQSRSCYLGDHRVLTNTVQGYKMYLDSRDISLTPHLIQDGIWEDWVTTAIQRLVRPGDRAVDVGANVGYFSLLLAGLVGKQGYVWSVEANAEIYELAYRNLEVNGFRDRSSVSMCAAYKEQTTLEFKVYEKHKGSSSIHVPDGDPEKYNDSVTTVNVEARKLDDIVGEGTVNFMKIDAEGSEPEVLLGADRLLTESTDLGIVLEFAPSFYAGTSRGADLLDLLSSRGFSFSMIMKDSSIKPVTREQLLARTEYCDVYAYKGAQRF
ncbi:FkbM family methyltransferase [Thiosocius teredinicola]|uniref:FkbM family methyltransferase n=1 Tax=Thiosocius teredinicola TaxID=1973002 RepID=UPI0009913621